MIELSTSSYELLVFLKAKHVRKVVCLFYFLLPLFVCLNFVVVSFNSWFDFFLLFLACFDFTSFVYLGSICSLQLVFNVLL